MFKSKVAIGVAGIAVLAGAGGTYAATRPTTHRSNNNERQAFLADAAKRLNVSPKELNDALQGAFSDRLDAAVSAGRLTRAQADEIKQHLQAEGGLPFGGGPPPGGPPKFFGGPGFHGGGPVFGAFDAASKYLGLSQEQLFRALASGKSLSQLAQDRNKSVDDLKKAIQDAAKAKLDAAVKAKELTQAQEDAMLKELDNHIDDLVNHAGPGPRFRMHGRGGLRFGGPPGGPRSGGGPEGSPGWGGPPPPP
jgi:transcriptional regulator with XRE-family HTH domain